jgi:hypothetical protein
VFQLEKPRRDIQLLRWNKELPSASAQDPLGLNLRLSARLAAELLHCITSITPRARYYSFFPWAFQDYLENEQGRHGDRGRIRGVLARERAMVLGTVFHHEGDTCDGGALGGSDGAIQIASEPTKISYGLESWQHLKAREGQFGAAYKASLINFGLFNSNLDKVNEETAPETDEFDDDVQSFEVTELSDRGKRLARAFHHSVQTTRYIMENWSGRSEAIYEVLQEFGSRAGLCEIAEEGAEDRAVLREIFFSCDRDSTKTAHYRRRMSLLLIMESIRTTTEAGVPFNQRSFGDLTYFGRVMSDEDADKSVAIALSDAVLDINQRWRIFHFHGYLTLALQSFLVGTVRVLRDQPAGVERSKILDQFDGSAIGARFHEIFGRPLPVDFFEMTPNETLSIAGVNVEDSLDGITNALDLLPIESEFGERHIARVLLHDKESNQIVGLALAALLLYLVLLRYQTTVDEQYDIWYQNHVQDRFADISIPGVLGSLRSEKGDAWWNRSNREILDALIWRFVLLQHQTMSYERGFGGSATLFHIDGTTVIGTETDYTDPSPLNARFSSAIQILMDLGLVAVNDDKFPFISDEGQNWLQELLDKEARQ